MTPDEATAIIDAFERNLTKLCEDVYAALDMALKALKEMPYMFTKEE
ncbi:MAG: hypothetical protein IJL91_06885 [Bacteroidales bacterium]|nr:hypothetical protein [Bacteroidales bacterium]